MNVPHTAKEVASCAKARTSLLPLEGGKEGGSEIGRRGMRREDVKKKRNIYLYKYKEKKRKTKMAGSI